MDPPSTQGKVFLRTIKSCETVTIKVWLAALPHMGSEILWRARGRKSAEGCGRATPFLPRQVCCAHRCPRPGLPPKRKSNITHLEIRDIPRGGAGVGPQAQRSAGEGQREHGRKKVPVHL